MAHPESWAGLRAFLARESLIDVLRLIRSENVGPVTFFNLVRQFGAAKAALDAIPSLAHKGGKTHAGVVLHIQRRGAGNSQNAGAGRTPYPLRRGRLSAAADADLRSASRVDRPGFPPCLAEAPYACNRRFAQRFGKRLSTGEETGGGCGKPQRRRRPRAWPAASTRRRIPARSPRERLP